MFRPSLWTDQGNVDNGGLQTLKKDREKNTTNTNKSISLNSQMLTFCHTCFKFWVFFKEIKCYGPGVTCPTSAEAPVYPF